MPRNEKHWLKVHEGKGFHIEVYLPDLDKNMEDVVNPERVKQEHRGKKFKTIIKEDIKDELGYRKYKYWKKLEELL